MIILCYTDFSVKELKFLAIQVSINSIWFTHASVSVCLYSLYLIDNVFCK